MKFPFLVLSAVVLLPVAAQAKPGQVPRPPHVAAPHDHTPKPRPNKVLVVRPH